MKGEKPPDQHLLLKKEGPEKPKNFPLVFEMLTKVQKNQRIDKARNGNLNIF